MYNVVLLADGEGEEEEEEKEDEVAVVEAFKKFFFFILLHQLCILLTIRSLIYPALLPK